MQLTAAAAGVCDLLWMIDGSLPEMRQMTDLLNRFGPVVNLSGLGADQVLKELSSPYEPDGIATYLDANMTTFAQVAEALNLPFHSVTAAVALTDKAEQRRVLREAGFDTPPCFVVTPEQAEGDLADIETQGRLARGPETTIGSRKPLHLLRPRPGTTRWVSDGARTAPARHGTRGLPR